MPACSCRGNDELMKISLVTFRMTILSVCQFVPFHNFVFRDCMNNFVDSSLMNLTVCKSTLCIQLCRPKFFTLIFVVQIQVTIYIRLSFFHFF